MLKHHHTQLPTHQNLPQLLQHLPSQIQKIPQQPQLLHLPPPLYIYNHHELYYLSSRSNPKYNPYIPPYPLQSHIIQFPKQHNIHRYNFYPLTPHFTQNPQHPPLQKFKQPFNPKIYQYIPDFIKPIKPLFYKL
ncbi:peptidoglycan bridge formation glycyltransferase FemA/FemB family protein, partial [Staphylococcus epidermidis]|uniref:peptidoglycan bridge formation glycyltransferase FemA/FemB family protein n=1 Tax=Staphylococcus epidermidis TaxID=1282 RepID=UPI0028CB7A10